MELATFPPLSLTLLSLSTLGLWLGPAWGQSIAPAPDGTQTQVLQVGDTYEISGGSRSGGGGNLFHSFQHFGLSRAETAQFLSSPDIANILGRVQGGDVSVINGLLQVTGSNANLFLMNPVGIIFGPDVRLDLSGSFAATTATAIGFDQGWFQAVGTHDYESLVGFPSRFDFMLDQPGGIVNFGDLAVAPGESLVLVGGTVVSTGSLSAPEGQVLVTAVSGNGSGNTGLQLRQPGLVLGLEIPRPRDWQLPVASLADLLTLGEPLHHASGLQVDDVGTVRLVGSGLAESGLAVESGDVVVRSLATGLGVVAADQNLTLVESELRTRGDLLLGAGNTVRVRDSVAQRFLAEAGGNLYLQGNEFVDILALEHLQLGAPFRSGGNLTLVSDGIVSGDAHFWSNGEFRILDTAGEPGTFVSFYDPIISSRQDVVFGDYTGASLKVETLGDIEAGNIRITVPDRDLHGSDPDIELLRNQPTLILRSRLARLVNPVSELPSHLGGTSFGTGGGSYQEPRIIDPDGIFRLRGGWTFV
jgi:filamentous hemagglutinin family protein